MASPNGPRCGGRYQEGFILDRADKSRATASWVEDAPERSFWTGLKLKDKARYTIVTHRCIQCGFLESYAPKI